MFNQALIRSYKPEDRSFYRIFKEMDLDSSQRISYNEVEALARERLNLAPKQLPASKLDLVWMSLDRDLSGYIDAGELSRFLRIGTRPHNGPPAQPAHARRLRARARAPSHAHGAAHCAHARAGKPKGLTAAQIARNKLHAEKVVDVKEVKEETRIALAGDVATKLKEYPPASKEEAEALGELRSRSHRAQLLPARTPRTARH